MRECSKVIGQKAFGPVNSAALSTLAHKKAYDMLGNNDPYRAIKEKSNEVALKLLPRANRFVEEARDRFKAATVVSIVGNILDYGITGFKDPGMLLNLFDNMYAEGLGCDDTSKIKTVLKTARSVVFLTDNCGEIIFDKLLLSQIKKYKVRITLVAKSIPILSDATIDDVRAFGLDEYADEMIGTGKFAVGVDTTRMPLLLRRRLENADIIVSKGMANYESLSDMHYRPIAYLMRTKCEPVADSLGLKKDINVALLMC